MTVALLGEPDTEIRGSVLPRIFTPPLITGPPGGCPCGCALTPDTSYGFDLIRFAEIIGWPFDPWQQFLAIHIGELLPDRRPRFRTVLIIVARQNGKTVFARVLILYWMFVEQIQLTIATHTDRGMAKRPWLSTIAMAEAVSWLREEMPSVHTRLQLGEEDSGPSTTATIALAHPTAEPAAETPCTACCSTRSASTRPAVRRRRRHARGARRPTGLHQQPRRP